MVEITLRASEIAQFAYCHRAWWYARQGHVSTNMERQRLGTRWHRRHRRTVLKTRFLRRLGYACLLAAAVAAMVHLAGISLG